MSALGYLRRLETLAPRGSLLTPVEVRLLLLTGQSSFAAAGLSAEQSAFLRAVAPERAAIVEAGFPFHGAMLDDAPTPGIVAASWRNLLQALWSVSSRRYRAIVQTTLQQALDTTERELLLVTGSCGLQMANRAWNTLTVPRGLGVRIVALGPACFGSLRLDAASVTIVQGDRDGWSRLMFRGCVDVRVPCGHLDYWVSSPTRAAVAAILR